MLVTGIPVWVFPNYGNQDRGLGMRRAAMPGGTWNLGSVPFGSTLTWLGIFLMIHEPVRAVRFRWYCRIREVHCTSTRFGRILIDTLHILTTVIIPEFRTRSNVLEYGTRTAVPSRMFSGTYEMGTRIPYRIILEYIMARVCCTDSTANCRPGPNGVAANRYAETRRRSPLKRRLSLF